MTSDSSSSRVQFLSWVRRSGTLKTTHAKSTESDWPERPPSPTQTDTVNVILFGETGVGKSSVINLIARKQVAKVSSDVNGCTMQSTRYNISFDGMDFSIFDTIGLEEPHMGVNGYLKAIERAYELILSLSAAGGIHLLLFCMRGGRITATTQSNYRLFCECLCNTKVPIALVFTGLERETEMEDWWRRNKTYIEYYGIKSHGHACITAVQDDTPGEDLKYTESQRKIRDLLTSCALQNDAFLPEPHTWFAKLGRGMKSFIEKHRSPKRKDVMRVLTHRCKLDPDTAKRIVAMMEKGETETKDDVPPNQSTEAQNPVEAPDSSVKGPGVAQTEGVAGDHAPGGGQGERSRSDGGDVKQQQGDISSRQVVGGQGERSKSDGGDPRQQQSSILSRQVIKGQGERSKSDGGDPKQQQSGISSRQVVGGQGERSKPDGGDPKQQRGSISSRQVVGGQGERSRSDGGNPKQQQGNISSRQVNNTPSQT